MAAAPIFDLVTIPSVLVDRRALSQAWYDALRLAQREPVERLHRGSKAPRLSVPHARRNGEIPQTRTAASGTRLQRTVQPGNAPAERRLAVAFLERRAPPSSLGRRIVAAVQREPRASNFTLATPLGRVHVCVRREHGTLRLIALCSPGARAHVERALAHARYALAGTGVAIAW